MPSIRALLALTCLAALAACSTTRQPAGPPVAMFARLKAEGVAPSTYQKIVAHRVLSYEDIYGLVKKDIPDAVILTYLKSTHAPYRLTDAQLEALDEAGAGDDLVNYLGKSVGFFEAAERSQTGGAGKWRNNPYFNDPYWGEPPFDAMWPGEWYDAGWMDGVF